ncbi:MAG TPA: GNAT family N-acetyltransferase [Candidatus Saccharimonadales bacterium]|nr:GNAT family N-acetyltransferase [Candidatus Saccharimonadales bacterium]
MANSDFYTARVVTGPEVYRVWEETGHGLPNAELWGSAIEAGANDMIAARRAGRAVGYVTIRWGGPHEREPGFYDMVSKNYTDGLPPAVYALYVDPDYRQQGAGRALMQAVERRVLEHPEALDSVVLNVDTKNRAARELYESMGYRILSSAGVEEFEIDAPPADAEMGEGPNYFRAIAMAKDLSR